TTTLHSLLGFLNTPELKIWTAEDPIEITQAGLRQVQMNPKIGWTFAAAMRGFMRADPDVVMVGEMRAADALLGVLSQRLVRRLCTQCRVRQEPSVREMEELAAEYCLDTPLEAEKVL